MTASVARSERWTLLLPPGWITVPTDPERARVAVRAATDDALRGRHRDELVMSRVELERELLALVAQAREQGAAAVHTLARPVRGVAVSASLVVAELSLGSDEEMSRGLARVFGEATGVVQSERVSVAGLEGLRRRRRQRRLLVEGVEASEAWVTNLDYVLATDPGEFLLLTYATATDEVADELVFLFDAMTESLHRRG